MLSDYLKFYVHFYVDLVFDVLDKLDDFHDQARNWLRGTNARTDR